MPPKKEEQIEQGFKLTPEEFQAIEVRRKLTENLEKFKKDYEKLVKETGFTWVVDANSPLNNIQLGIAQITK